VTRRFVWRPFAPCVSIALGRGGLPRRLAAADALTLPVCLFLAEGGIHESVADEGASVINRPPDSKAPRDSTTDGSRGLPADGDVTAQATDRRTLVRRGRTIRRLETSAPSTGHSAQARRSSKTTHFPSVERAGCRSNRAVVIGSTQADQACDARRLRRQKASNSAPPPASTAVDGSGVMVIVPVSYSVTLLKTSSWLKLAAPSIARLVTTRFF